MKVGDRTRWGAIALCILMGACSDAADGGGAGRQGPSPSILWITLDTTRADHMGYAGRKLGDRTPTPNLDALAAEGHAYLDARVSVPLTLPSHTSMMTGLEPPQHGVRENEGFRLPPRGEGRDFPTAAEYLSARGYRCAAFVSSRPLARGLGLEAGFETYDDPGRPQTGGALAFAERDAATTTEKAIDWIAGAGEGPTFLWVHYFDPHHPWQPHGGRAGAIAEAFGSLYDGEIAFVDDAIGRLIAAFRGRFDWDESLVVVIGDHGEGLGEHGEESHGLLLHDATIRVPLIVKPPRGRRAALVDRRARSIDLFPTLVATLGGDAVVGAGRSLYAGLDDGDAVYAESVYGFRNHGWAMMRSLTSGPLKLVQAGRRHQLFDLSTDPGELVDLAADRPETVDGLRRSLLDFRRRSGTRVEKARRRPDPEIDAVSYLSTGDRSLPDEPMDDDDASREAAWNVMDVAARLDSLRLSLDRLERSNDRDPEHYTELGRLVSMLTADSRPAVVGSPAVLFWTARAELALGRAGRAFGLSVEQAAGFLQQALGRLDRLLERRPNDGRARDFALKVAWERFRLDADRKGLEDLVARSLDSERRGLATELTAVFAARALENLGRGPEALSAMEKAHERAPERADIARDLEALRQRLKP